MNEEIVKMRVRIALRRAGFSQEAVTAFVGRKDLIKDLTVLATELGTLVEEINAQTTE